MLGPLLLLASAGGAPPTDMGPPPGCVAVPGGKTVIGIAVRDLERLVQGDAEAQRLAGAISAETPQHVRTVAPFHLMATEVTNEQFLVYVEATGARPPIPWADAALETGRAEHLEEAERAREAARATGGTPPQTRPFDAEAWWRAHWPGQPYAVPPGDELRPVVFVTYEDALGYARWAGLRLMTELEFQRAARGDTQRAYPWGDAWKDDGLAATSALPRKSGAFPVGRFPAGATRSGIFDLSGNVWEWTQSPYTAYAGWEPRMFDVGYGSKRITVNAVTEFSAERQVVVGGSFQNGPLEARCTTRSAASRSLAKDAIGFRCAASATAGLDHARRALEETVTANVRPLRGGEPVAYDPEQAVAALSWDARGSLRDGAPPGYAVITRHRYALFVPVAEVPSFDATTFQRLAEGDELLPVGFFETSLALVSPELAPGTYLVAYRARGAARARSNGGGETPSVAEALQLSAEHDHVVFLDLAGVPRAAVRQRIEFGPWREGRAAIVEPEDAPRTGTPGDAPPASDARLLRIELCLRCPTKHRGLLFALAFEVEPGGLDGTWW